MLTKGQLDFSKGYDDAEFSILYRSMHRTQCRYEELNPRTFYAKGWKACIQDYKERQE